MQTLIVASVTLTDSLELNLQVVVAGHDHVSTIEETRAVSNPPS